MVECKCVLSPASVKYVVFFFFLKLNKEKYNLELYYAFEHAVLPAWNDSSIFSIWQIPRHPSSLDSNLTYPCKAFSAPCRQRKWFFLHAVLVRCIYLHYYDFIKDEDSEDLRPNTRLHPSLTPSTWYTAYH